MPHPPPDAARGASPLPTLVVVAGAGLLLLWAWVVLQRIGYPHALEVMEEGMAAHALRVLDGEPVYAPPSLEWTPFVYGPVYYWLSAGVFAVFDPHLWGLRLISVAATGYVLWALGACARELSGSSGGRLAGLAAAALFAGTYFVSGAWFDLGRVDMLRLAFALASFRALRRDAPARAALWGLLAVFTKQSTLGILLGMAIGHAFHDPGKALRYAAGLVLGTAAGLVAGAWLTDGWMLFYMFTLPGQHPFLWRLLPEVLGTKLAVELCGAVVLAALGAAVLLRRCWRRAMMPLGFAGAALAVSCLARLRDGGWYNVMIPAHAGLCLLAGVGVGAVLGPAPAELGRRLLRPLRGRRPAQPAPDGLRRVGLAARAGVGALLAVQALLFLFDHREGSWRDPRALVPTPEQRRNADAVAATLEAIDEPVYAPSKVLTLRRAGLPSWADATALWDIARASDRARAAELERAVAAALAGTRFRALLLNAPGMEALAPRHPLVVAAYAEGTHAHAALPVLDEQQMPHQGYERLWWYLRPGDDELRALVEAARRR